MFPSSHTRDGQVLARDRGFTLIEILIAIVLVGILSAVVVVGVGALTGSGSAASCTASMDAVRTATEVHYANARAYPTTFTDMTGATPAELSLSSGVSVDGSGLAVTGEGWTLTMTPGTAGARPTYTCDTGVPDGFVAGPNGHYYRFVSTPLTWAAARTAAAATVVDGRAGYLATITSAAEQAFAVSLIGSTWTWLGATDAGVEGVWTWVTGPEAGTTFWQGARAANGGAPVGGAYTAWDTALQPDDSGNEDCMHLWPSYSGHWNDWICGNTAGYLVEIG